MRLTFTVDIPLNNPEEILDLKKLDQSKDASYILYNQDPSDDNPFKDYTFQNLESRSHLHSANILSIKPEISKMIDNIKTAYPDEVLSLEFPGPFALRYPHHFEEYKTSQIRYNSLHNEVFTLLDTLEHFLGHSESLSQISQTMIENVIKNLENQKIDSEVEKNDIQSKFDKIIEKNVEMVKSLESENEDLKQRLHEIGLICDEKDVVIEELQTSYDSLYLNFSQTSEKLKDALAMIEEKLKNVDEMNRYIHIMLIDKKELKQTIEIKSKEVIQTELKIENLKDDHEEKINKLRSYYETEMEKMRRKYESEINREKYKEFTSKAQTS